MQTFHRHQAEKKLNLLKKTIEALEYDTHNYEVFMHHINEIEADLKQANKAEHFRSIKRRNNDNR